MIVYMMYTCVYILAVEQQCGEDCARPGASHIKAAGSAEGRLPRGHVGVRVAEDLCFWCEKVEDCMLGCKSHVQSF
eukprot:COSAG02_NODE_8283_length_2632_cov_39.773343_1_plen_76_part_00